VPPLEKPDLSRLQVAVARREGRSSDGADVSKRPLPLADADGKSAKRRKWEARAAAVTPSTRLFVGNLPFVLSASGVRAALGAAIAAEALASRLAAANGGGGGGSGDGAHDSAWGGGGCGGASWAAEATSRDDERTMRKARELITHGGVPAPVRAKHVHKDEAQWSDRRGKVAHREAEQAASKRAAEAAAAAAATVGDVHWLTDPMSGLFYGSAMVHLESIDDASAIVRCANARPAALGAAGRSGLRLGGRKLRISFCAPRADAEWQSAVQAALEYPPPAVL